MMYSSLVNSFPDCMSNHLYRNLKSVYTNFIPSTNYLDTKVEHEGLAKVLKSRIWLNTKQKKRKFFLDFPNIGIYDNDKERILFQLHVHNYMFIKAYTHHLKL